MLSSKQDKQEVYHWCFYHVYSGKHVNYHHVIMKFALDELNMVKSLEGENYQYCLISAQPYFIDEMNQEELIIRGLIMDGESLLKRFKSATKKSISTSNQE